MVPHYASWHCAAIHSTAWQGTARHGMTNHLGCHLVHLCIVFCVIWLSPALLRFVGMVFGTADTAEADAQQPGERVPGGISHHAPQLAQYGSRQPPDHSCGLAHRVRTPLHLQLHTVLRERQGEHLSWRSWVCQSVLLWVRESESVRQAKLVHVLCCCASERVCSKQQIDDTCMY